MAAYGSLVVFLALCAAAGASGVICRPGAWYQTLAKPAWRPPDRLFGPVWLVLYVMIAVAGWRVWQIGGAGSGLALALYGVQLMLNGLWSVVFFGLRRPGWGLVEIVGLWSVLLATTAAFAAVDTVAAGLLVPYVLWVTFAVALSYRVWQLNRG